VYKKVDGETGDGEKREAKYINKRMRKKRDRKTGAEDDLYANVLQTTHTT
jgi:hypothetical protein